MKPFVGKLSDGDQVLLARVEGLIEQKPEPEAEWAGHFSLPETSVGPVRRGKTYRLDLKSGPALRVVVDRILHGHAIVAVAEFHSRGLAQTAKKKTKAQ